MQLRILADNHTYIDQYYLGEPAACYYIEVDGKRILFDTGYSDVAVRNASAMGIDLNGLDYLVFSHGHNDHTRGLTALTAAADLSATTVVAHPECFLPRQVEGEDIGAPFDRAEMERKFHCMLSAKPIQLTPSCLFLGQIPRQNDFEGRTPIGFITRDGRQQPDTILDDSALAFQTPRGLFIVTGCSHSGICNITRYAMELTGCTRIAGILGGFHLFRADEQLKKTVEYLTTLAPEELYPCHCVSLRAKAEMMKCLPVKEAGVNMQLTI